MWMKEARNNERKKFNSKLSFPAPEHEWVFGANEKI